MKPPTLAHMFVQGLQRHADRPFVRWLDGEMERALSYEQAARLATGVVAALRARGVSPGDRVVVATEDIRRSLLFEVGCAIAGAVHVPAIPPTPPTVERLVRRVQAKAVFSAGRQAEELVQDDVHPLCMDERIAGAVVIEPVEAPAEHIAAAIAADADQLDGSSLYMLQPTSGTTSDPKLVMRQHRVFVRAAALLAYDLAQSSAERILMVAAMTHGMGQYLMSTGLLLAATFVIPSEMDTASSLEEVRRLDPTYIGVTPRVLRSYVRQHGGAGSGGALFGPSARTLLAGGSKTDGELLQFVESQGVRVTEGYGASEFSVVALATPGTWRTGVIGRILPDVTLKVDSDGQLLAKTPGMMLGYFGDPALTRAAFDDDGFYRTGDKCEITPSGELMYLGRTTDAFNIHGGVNVSPQPAEHELERLAWVAQALLLGDQRPFVAALLVPVPGCASGAADRRALRALVQRDVGRLNEQLDPAARIRAVRLLDRPFGDQLYRVVGHGKVSRNRPAADRALASEIAALYDPSPEAPETIEIPGAATDRRRGVRSELSWLARVEIGQQSHYGYTRNVSRTGTLIDLSAELPVGARVDVTLFVVGKAICLPARIARCADGGLALEFEDPRASRTALIELLPR